ncbi:dihydropteroate synthase [Psychroflexus torquis ATCC 700755]|uniref:Dihydropteroate synthase n=1 Tax=Psychroflexus torquis (strain ATCC 700755 / CIP 106069 / ACAM 623) TaxID=313595 RepID=K4IPI4_PSYTT|nr:dihydropteroate synthase [Psychroflexus torquis]AFU67430.1 dihydropteroate synthase [Psychroflexus torquis ATCC 700755]
MTINCKGRLLDLSTPKVMGVLNLTPDSFYDGGKFKNDKEALEQVEKNIQDGMDILDIGAYSSRPGADHISEEEELKRQSSVLQQITKEFPDLIISIDTFRSEVAKASIDQGAHIINDISAGNLDANMMDFIADSQVPYIMMHMRGTPQTMKSMTSYKHLVTDIISYFSKKVLEARAKGINDLLIDPGFGFAKTIDQNFELLNHLKALKSLNLPILSGISRKSTIYKTLNIDAKEALNGTTALNMVALMNGSSILRVHDVLEAKQCITLYQKLIEN